MEKPILNEHEYHLYQELRDGRLSRRDFLRRASILGLGLPTVGAILAACGGGTGSGATGTSGQSGGAPKRGGNATVGISTPAAAPDPVLMYDEGSIVTCQIAGEYLCWPNNDYSLQPRLATGWKADSPSEFTFTLRQGVKFHGGQTMTADDVVATFDRLTDPKSNSAALSAFKGILAQGQTEKLDSYTVKFHLSTPFVDFPYLVSGFNYNAIILPASYQAGSFLKTPQGTGAFMVDTYSVGQETTYKANPHYWSKGMPYLDAMTLKYFSDNQSQVLAMQGKTVDVIPLAPYGSQALYADSSIVKMRAPSSGYRTIQMRTDMAPFDNQLLRQAVAWCLDRKGMISSLLSGFGELGNDNAFAPVFPQSADAVKQVPQREQNIPKAKALLVQAGKPQGFSVTLTTEQYLEIPALAQALQANCKQAGIDVKLNVEPQSTYYGSGSNQPWLSVPFGITDWAARGVPAQTILPAYTATGVWNSAHWKDPEFDNLFAQFNGTLDEQSRLSLAARMAQIQWTAVPDAIPYWFIEVRLTQSNVHGLAAGPAEWFDPRGMWLS